MSGGQLVLFGACSFWNLSILELVHFGAYSFWSLSILHFGALEENFIEHRFTFFTRFRARRIKKKFHTSHIWSGLFRKVLLIQQIFILYLKK
jgi:hypothetical protein